MIDTRPTAISCIYRIVHFKFDVVTFPNLRSDIPVRPSYGVFVGELYRICKSSLHCYDFINDVKLLINKLVSQMFNRNTLYRFLKSFLNGKPACLLKNWHNFRVTDFFQDCVTYIELPMKGSARFSSFLIRQRTNLALVLIVELGPLSMTCYNLDYSLFPFGAVALVLLGSWGTTIFLLLYLQYLLIVADLI